MALVSTRGKDGTLCLVNLWAEKSVSLLKESFFEEFPSKISHVKIGSLWRDNREHIPFEWFSVKSSQEAFAISLFGLLGGLLKQLLTKESGLLSSRVFKRVMNAINNAVNNHNVGSVIDAQTPKSQRIAILEKELKFYPEQVREVEVLILAVMEIPPETPLPSKLIRSSNLESVEKSSLGPITKK